MARQVQVTLIDDIDGTPADSTVYFGFEGLHYEIDLSQANLNKLRDFLRPYIKAGRRSAPRSSDEAARIRAWAKDKGYEVSNRGRLHQDIIAKYREAHRA